MKNTSFTGILGINFETETTLTNVVLVRSIEKIVTKFLIFIFNSQGIDYQQKHIQMWIYEYCRIEFWILLKICYFVQIYFNFRRPILCINMTEVLHAYECSGWEKDTEFSLLAFTLIYDIHFRQISSFE